MKKFLKIFTFGGLCYNIVELIFRLITDPKSISLKQSISMFIVGGLCVYLTGLINENIKLNKLKMIYQAIIATIIILEIELLSGIILNIWLGLNIWDYSHLRFNILGQVCLQFGFGWLFLTPLSFYVDDKVREEFLNEEDCDSLLEYYKKFFTLK